MTLGEIAFCLVGISLLVGVAEWVVVGAFCVLGYQSLGWLQTGHWLSYTAANLFDISPGLHPTNWVQIDRGLHYVLFDAEVAIVVMGFGFVGFLVKGFLASAYGAPPAPKPAASAPPPGPWDVPVQHDR
jgi:hypothetical protein